MGEDILRGKAQSGPAVEKAIDPAEVRRALAALADRDGEVEVRSLRPNRSAVGFGSDLDGMTTAVLEGMAHANAVYLCLNPVSLDAPSCRSASDQHVTRRRWLFIDLDALRKDAKENCATDGEKDAARQAKDALRDYLTGKGWPLPVEVDSGNGYYLLYRVELPNDEDSRTLLRTLLHSLSERCGEGGGVKVDRAVHNASRIARLPGTWNRKGKSTTERPHRLCRLLVVPEALDLVTRAQLEAEAGEIPQQQQAPPPPPHETNGKHEGADAFRGKATSGNSGDARTRLERYVRNALDKEALEVALAIRGHQGGHGGNNTLNEAAFSMGTMAHWNAVAESEVIDKLTRAASRAGLDDGEIGPTIQSGMRAGKACPRQLPPWAASSSSSNGKATEQQQPAEGGQAGGGLRWEFSFGEEVVAQGSPDEVRDALSGADKDGGLGDVRRFEVLTIGELMARDFPEPEWVVQGIMSEGLNILAGAPKQGKSMLALNLALTVAGGGKALGDVQVNASDVLYLSLEDMQRRVKARAVRMLKKLNADLSEGVSRRLSVVTDWPRQDEGGLRCIELWTQRAERPGLVIIDVWNRFAPAMQRHSNAYSHDAAAMAEVKRFAERHGFSILIVHHTRKPGMKDPEDFVHEISGTMGLSGAADGILVLTRARGETQASLHVTGRDVDEQEIVLEFDKNSLTWRSLGSKAHHVEGRVQEKVVRFLRSQRPTAYFVKDVAEAVKEKPDSVKKACANLCENKIIRKVGHAYSYPGEAVSPDGSGLDEEGEGM